MSERATVRRLLLVVVDWLGAELQDRYVQNKGEAH